MGDNKRFSQENLDDLFGDAREDCGVLGGELGKDFSIKLDAGLF